MGLEAITKTMKEIYYIYPTIRSARQFEVRGCEACDVTINPSNEEIGRATLKALLIAASIGVISGMLISSTMVFFIVSVSSLLFTLGYASWKLREEVPSLIGNTTCASPVGKVTKAMISILA